MSAVRIMKVSHYVRDKTIAGCGPFPATLTPLMKTVAADGGHKVSQGKPIQVQYSRS